MVNLVGIILHMVHLLLHLYREGNAVRLVLQLAVVGGGSLHHACAYAAVAVATVGCTYAQMNASAAAGADEAAAAAAAAAEPAEPAADSAPPLQASLSLERLAAQVDDLFKADPHPHDAEDDDDGMPDFLRAATPKTPKAAPKTPKSPKTPSSFGVVAT